MWIPNPRGVELDVVDRLKGTISGIQSNWEFGR